MSIIVNEIRVVDTDFDIEEVNRALELVGKAEIDGGYIRGTISSEVISYQTKKRNGFLVDILTCDPKGSKYQTPKGIKIINCS